MEAVIQSGGYAVAEARGLLKASAVPATAAPAMKEAMKQPVTNSSENFGFTEVASNVQPVNHLPNFSLQPIAHQKPVPPPSQSFQAPPEQTQATLHRKKKKSHVPFILLGFLGGLAVLAGTVFIAAQQLMKAQIDLELNTKVVSKDVALTLDPNVPQSDPQKLVLKAETVTKDETGQKNTNTTGTKLIGDKAKGKVTIFNLTSNAKTFSAGTAVTNGTLKFILDQTVTVASASTSQDSSTNAIVTNPSTVDASVTAAQIRPDSNLAKGSDFTIES